MRKSYESRDEIPKDYYELIIYEKTETFDESGRYDRDYSEIIEQIKPCT
ncbi:hypothetical protein Hs30E_09030 [Lactococcus hodotermopsidis]|uniref:Uncharacterized protein n=2 Tax=Pseudolactococcus hodotermopsidis TaxID=2709157 RepID=A0A6A0BAD5_9LACT|nr:hypothetical protein Hs30E_09030 [Lactococcus hodotermopsidis]